MADPAVARCHRTVAARVPGRLAGYIGGIWRLAGYMQVRSDVMDVA